MEVWNDIRDTCLEGAIFMLAIYLAIKLMLRGCQYFIRAVFFSADYKENKKRQ